MSVCCYHHTHTHTHISHNNASSTNPIHITTTTVATVQVIRGNSVLRMEALEQPGEATKY